MAVPSIGNDSCCHHRKGGPRSALSLKVDAVRARIWVLLHLEVVHAQPEVPEQRISELFQLAC